MLENLEGLERACQCGWILTTAQLSELIGLSRRVLAREDKPVERHGFTFTRSGKIGVEIGWKVGKCNAVIAQKTKQKKSS